MKKLILSAVFISIAVIAKPQSTPSGLDSVIVETYYISNANDTSVTVPGGRLPIGSFTYRIFVDMKPGYTFEAAYGIDISPTGIRNPGDHELRISTTPLFFN